MQSAEKRTKASSDDYLVLLQKKLYQSKKQAIVTSNGAVITSTGMKQNVPFATLNPNLGQNQKKQPIGRNAKFGRVTRTNTIQHASPSGINLQSSLTSSPYKKLPLGNLSLFMPTLTSNDNNNINNSEKIHPFDAPLNITSKNLKKGELVFSSNFESGNLGKVRCVSLNEYELYIRPDTNNPNYRLWFYFGINNTKRNQRVLFSIVNFSKAKSLYRLGMTPLVKSSSRPYWERLPERQCFYYRMKNSKNYALSFLFEFDREEDDYHFSYCYPYTYTDLQKFLFNIETKSLPYFKRELLTKTIQCRRVELITITEPENLIPENSKKKQTVFITARVHPGESPASYICHGFMSFLISNHRDARLLRENIIFKIVPMLNPDGVFLGNYRCSSVGHDLNRFWLNPEWWAHPTIWATRELLLRLKNDPNINLDFFIDIHSHSSATNGFMYVNYMDDSAQKEEQLAYPRLLDLKAKEFSFSDTRVCRDVSKIGTGRRALGETLQVAKHCYTLEVSFYCFTQDLSKHVPFTQENYVNMGKSVAMTFLDYYKLSHKNTSSSQWKR